MAANSMLSLSRVVSDPVSLVAGCIDKEAAEIISAHVPGAEIRFLKDTGFAPRFPLDKMTGDYNDFFSKRFTATATARYAFIDQLNQEGRDVLYSDADIAFQASPMEPLRELSRRYFGRVVAQSDTPIARFRTGELDSFGSPVWFGKAHQIICTGLMYWPSNRPNRRLPKLIVETALNAEAREGGNDQHCVNHLGKLARQRFVLAPLRQFPNGSLCFEPDGSIKPMPGYEGFEIEKAITIHANYIVGMEGKQKALENTGHWLL